MRSFSDERRRYSRVGMVLPVELDEYDGRAAKEKNQNGRLAFEVADLSKGGVKIVSSEDLDKHESDKLGIRINLPPCYSSDPRKALPIDILSELRWRGQKAGGRLHEYGLEFLDVEEDKKSILDNVITSELERMTRQKTWSPARPQFEIKREVHACNMYAADLTVGCEHDCLYCHFARHRKDQWLKKYPQMEDFPIPVDISPVYDMKDLPSSVVYLSPSSDAFAPAARDATHEILSYLLPKGVIFTISTKNIIPDRTIELLRKYSGNIEGLSVGITNMDEERNSILEPGCPTAEERLEGAAKLTRTGCTVGVRMDPIFPEIDDSEESMFEVVKKVQKTGVDHISGTYLFTFGNILREMKRHPYLRKAAAAVTDRSYPIGGKAFSVPMSRKIKTYDFLHKTCRSMGICFMTCGCKDTRLRDRGYSLICRNVGYYDGKKNMVEEDTDK